jgi:galactose mutarotase-like enzyme
VTPVDHLDLGLGPDDETRAVFPFEFECRYRLQALPRGVALDLLVVNRGERALPVAPGWHPYFVCTDKSRVESDVPGWDRSRLSDEAEFDFGLPLPARSRFEVPGVGGLTLEVEEGLRHLQAWSLPGKPFVCLEPFAGPANHINTKARDEIEAGGERHYTVRLTLD